MPALHWVVQLLVNMRHWRAQWRASLPTAPQGSERRVAIGIGKVVIMMAIAIAGLRQ